RQLAQIISSVLPGGRAQSVAFNAMLTRMRAEGAAGFASWAALLQAVQALEPKVVPADAFKISAHDVAAIRALEDAKKRQKRAMIWSVAGAVLLLAITGAIVYKKLVGGGKNFEKEQVHVPASEFIYQDGQKVTLPELWI